MQYIHSREYLNRGDVVELACDTQCNFILTDDINYSRFQRRESFTYYVGFVKNFPAQIAAPSSGYWNITLDLGGASANIRYGLRVLNRG